MTISFEEAGLKDTPLMRQAFELSYDALIEKVNSKTGILSVENRQEAFKVAGFKSIDDVYKKIILRVAMIMQDSGVVSESAIAAALLNGAVKQNPLLSRELDDEVVGYIEENLAIEKRTEGDLMKVISDLLIVDDPEIYDSLSNTFAKALKGDGVPLSMERNVMLKAGAIAAMEVLGSTSGEDEGLIALTMGKAISIATEGLPSTPVDDLFEKTLKNTGVIPVELKNDSSETAIFMKKNLGYSHSK